VSMVVPMGISVIEEKVKMELETMNCPSASLIDDYFQHLDIASASGRIVSFMNDLVPFPFLELKANMEAQQDLHGYDHPWPEGGGRNQLDFTVDSVKALNTEGTWSDNAYTHLGVTFTIQTDSAGNITGINVNGTSSSQSELSIMSSITLSSACILNSGSTDVRLRLWASGNIHVSMGTDVEVPAGTYSCEYAILSGDGTISNKVSKPMVRLATDSDPSYAPPSNICPITGYDEANVYHTGVNLFGGELLRDGVLNGVSDASDNPTNRYVEYKASYTYIQPFTKILDGKFKENTRYTFILKVYKSSGVGTNMRVVYTDGTATSINGATGGGVTTIVFVSASNKTIDYLGKQNSSGTTRLYYDESGIFEGVLTAGDFVAFKGNTYTETFDNTVYGGTLNLLTGVLTLTHGIADLYNRTWTYNSSNAWFYASMPSDSPTSKNYGYEGICDRYKVVQEHTTTFKNDDMAVSYCNLSLSSSKRIFIRDSRYTDATAFKNSLNGSKLVYQLGTPQTVQLTAQQVKMLAGQNNVWSDVDEVEVKYYVKA